MEPAKPENEAPRAKASSFVEMGLTPVQSAAVSSSRMAIHARPRRESRSRFIAHSESTPMIAMRKYHGTGSVSNGTPGRCGRPTGFTPFSPPVRFRRSIGRQPPISIVTSPRFRIATGMISPKPSVMIAPRGQKADHETAERGAAHAADAAEHGRGEGAQPCLVAHPPLADVVIH